MSTQSAMHDPTGAEVSKFPKPPELEYDRSFAALSFRDESGNKIDLFLRDPAVAFAIAVAATRAGDFLDQEAKARAEAQGTVSV